MINSTLETIIASRSREDLVGIYALSIIRCGGRAAGITIGADNEIARHLYARAFILSR